MAVLAAGFALGACGGASTTSTAAGATGTQSAAVRSATTGITTGLTTSSVITGTATTSTTRTYTVVGTTPLGDTDTRTIVHVDTTPAGPNGLAVLTVPALAPLPSTLQGQITDGIQCNRVNQLAYQAYSVLEIFVHGQPRALPGGIGLVLPNPSDGTVTTYSQSMCAYWVRTSAANGLIKTLSPVPRRYTLGNLFDLWGQPLGRHRLAALHGRVTVLVNGRPWRATPRAVPLAEHATIEVALGTPVPHVRPVDWAATGL